MSKISRISEEFPQAPAPGQVVEVADGLLWTRFSLPFALNHINVFLLDDLGGWAVVDAGLGDTRTQEAWTALLEGPLHGRRLSQLIVTHSHPDHVGLAGWLARKFDIPVQMTEAEHLLALHLIQNPRFVNEDHYRNVFRRHGLANEIGESVISQARAFPNMVSDLPPDYRQICPGDRLAIGGRHFEVMTGGGHSSDMAMLFCAEEGLFLAADQVLLQISPNISVMPGNPEGDPLGLYLASLSRLKTAIPDRALVLPGHNHPFRGLHGRIDELRAHHAERCQIVADACADTPLTAGELVPLLFPRPLDVHQASFAFRETLAHVNLMIRDGRLKWRCDAGVLRAAS